MISLLIDYTIPLWGIIALITPFAIAAIWAIIIMHFSNKANKVAIDKLERDYYSQGKAIEHFKKEIEDKLDKHKSSTDEKLNALGKTVVETHMLVRLLVDNKINTNQGNQSKTGP